jgi:hypothetical protein
MPRVPASNSREYLAKDLRAVTGVEQFLDRIMAYSESLGK